MLTAKKRFEILKRDGFKCQYCGKTWKDITLEVDHIIPKSKGGTDDVDNLITCCRECNMWKWNTELTKTEWYKYVINKYVKMTKSEFYTEWNKRGLGTIDDKTTRLLSLIVKLVIWWDSYTDFLIRDETQTEEQVYALFKTWWEYCEKVMKNMKEFVLEDLNSIIDHCANDDEWSWKSKDNLSLRLNYKLSELCRYFELWDNYMIKKYSLFPNLISND